MCHFTAACERQNRGSAGADLRGHLCGALDRGRRQRQDYGHTVAGQRDTSVDAESSLARKASAEVTERTGDERPAASMPGAEPAILLGCPHAGQGTGRTEGTSFLRDTCRVTHTSVATDAVNPFGEFKPTFREFPCGHRSPRCLWRESFLQPGAHTADSYMLLNCRQETSLWWLASSADTWSLAGAPTPLTPQAGYTPEGSTL